MRHTLSFPVSINEYPSTIVYNFTDFFILFLMYKLLYFKEVILITFEAVGSSLFILLITLKKKGKLYIVIYFDKCYLTTTLQAQAIIFT